MLQYLKIQNFTTSRGYHFPKINLSYECFGQPLYQAPIVLVNHALTGNSSVSGDQGWWNELIGPNKCIDTNAYTIIAFNIPGNGYDNREENLILDYKSLIARDIAVLFQQGLQQLEIHQLYAIIGGSVGGGIGWEIVAAFPNLSRHFIPIAADWKSTDWLKANCLVQEQILLNSRNPVHDARLHAMLCYRTPKSFHQKFNRSYNETQQMYNIESWLLHHGKKLHARFELASYKLLNHILANIDITEERGDLQQIVANITTDIHIISVNSDLFFTADENQRTFEILSTIKTNITHQTIYSDHGHDAFLIEYEQLTSLLKNTFKNI